MSTIRVTNLQNASAASPAIVLDANSRATLNGLSYPTDGSLSGRNRIINGDMRIDQRNAGASGTANGYTVDRFAYFGSQASKGTWQQNAGSVTPPAGFKNYLGFTSSSAYTVTSTDEFEFYQSIEGFNVADLDWGTANAKTVILSFWVRSSLTGTFGGALQNSSGNRSYPYSYTISAANTWEQKSITVTGDTSGTWQTTNGTGITIYFGLGAVSSKSGTAGAWSGSYLVSATGATSVVGTNGATFYITGVQLEAGSVATPFERRSYGQELALCQRYYEKSYDQSVTPGTATTNGLQFATVAFNSTNANGSIVFKTNKRSAPTMVYYDSAGTSGKATYQAAGTWFTGVTAAGLASNETGATLVVSVTSGNAPHYVQYTATAEL